MGGKTTSSSQQVSIPPDVLARYNSVNATAQNAASTPFQQYGGEFVAPVNATQGAGIGQIGAASQEAQPYFGAATTGLGAAQAGTQPVNAAAEGLAAAGAGPVNASNLDAAAINKYMNPYLSTVLGSTASLINQENQQAAGGESGNAIRSGAFGGDREGVAQANLQQQQILGEGNVFSGIASNAYNSALGAAQQQQGVNLQAGQANRAALETAGTSLAGIGQTAYGEGANTAAEMANLGTGAQSAGLAGGQAVLGAGTVQQQTQQAQDAAVYNQFLQQQSYPFQTAQFLANIAEGTGALSGSTTNTTQPGGFFSDKRLKEDVRPIGKLFDGQTVVRFRYKGEPHMRIGLIAQDVERHHPEAVGLHPSGYKTVEHGAATADAAERGHFKSGGGIVDITHIGERYADGGITPVVLPGVGAGDINAILQMQRDMYGNAPGGKTAGARAAGLNVPTSSAPPPLAVAAPLQHDQRTPAQNTSDTLKLAQQGRSAYKTFGPKSTPKAADTGAPDPYTGGLSSGQAPVTADAAAPDVAAPDAASLTADAPADVGAAATDATTADSATAGLAGGAAADTAVAGTAADAAAAAAAADAGIMAGGDEAAMALAALAAKRGGSVRSGLAAGGMPYSPANASMQGIDIPDENAHNKLLASTTPVKPAQSTIQQAAGMPNQMMGMLQNPSSTIPNLATGGLAGRVAKADAGAVVGDDDPLTTARQDPANLADPPDFWGSLKSGASDIWNGLKEADKPASQQRWAQPRDSGLAGAVHDFIAQPPTGPAASRERTAAKTSQSVAPDSGQAPVAALPASQPAGGLAPPVEAQHAAQAPTAVSAPAAPTPGLAAAAAPPPEQTVPQPAGGPSMGSRLAAAGTGLKDKLSSVWDNIKSADSSTLQGAIPLLTGLAAMGTAPTRHLGVALSAGLGAAGQSYMDTKKQLADVGVTNVEAARRAQLITNGAFDEKSGMVHLADGSFMPYAKYITLATPPAVFGSAQALGAVNNPSMGYAKVGKSQGFGAPGAAAADTGYAVPSPAAISAVTADAGQNMLPARLADAQKRTHDVEDATSGLPASAAVARQQGTQLTNLARTIGDSPDAGLSSGALQPVKLRATQIWNDIMTTAGHGKGAANDFTIGDEDLSNALVQRKLAAGLQFAQASASGQHSLEALQAAGHTNPDGTIPRAAAAEMTANLMIEKQRAIDEDNYERATRHAVQHPGYDASAARAQFRHEFSDERYQKERNSLVDLIQRRPSGVAKGSVVGAMLDGNARYNPADLEAAYGMPGLSRYFYNR